MYGEWVPKCDSALERNRRKGKEVRGDSGVHRLLSSGCLYIAS